jgi:ribokinase
MPVRGAGVAILGVFVADLAFGADRMPKVGETILSRSFRMGPGGKGSNQAIAAARAGAAVTFISRLGNDEFGATARATWQREGIVARVADNADESTGAAFIYVNNTTGENAIIVCAGAANAITAADVDAEGAAIRGAAVFLTQLEQPLAAAERGLRIAREAGVTTILNPAPGMQLPDAVYSLCDYVTPNESEAEALTGVAVVGLAAARRAGDVLLGKGARAALITLGEAGALLHDRSQSILVPAFDAGPVVDTAGAGDAFNGGFAAAIARGAPAAEAARFGCAVAGISVTRRGTATSMPRLDEVERLLGKG